MVVVKEEFVEQVCRRGVRVIVGVMLIGDGKSYLCISATAETR